MIRLLIAFGVLSISVASCGESKFIIKKKKISKDTIDEYSSGHQFNDELLTIRLMINKKMATTYYITPANRTNCKNYLIMKSYPAIPNKESWVATSDTNQSKIMFCNGTYRNIKTPIELRKVTQQDTTLIQKFINGYLPAAKEQILFSLNRSIGFVRVD